MRVWKRIQYHSGWIVGVSFVLLGLWQLYIGIQFQRTTGVIDVDMHTWFGGALAIVGCLLFVWWLYVINPQLLDGRD